VIAISILIIINENIEITDLDNKLKKLFSLKYNIKYDSRRLYFL
jgi:hypothetical protein